MVMGKNFHVVYRHTISCACVGTDRESMRQERRVRLRDRGAACRSGGSDLCVACQEPTPLEEPCQ